MAVEKAVAAPAASLATIHRFQKIVLSWDYLRLVRESTKKDAKGGTTAGLKHVKNTYKDVEEYIGVFEPLLFEEVKALIIQGRDEEDETDWQKGAVASCAETDEFHNVSLVVLDEFRERVSENDLLLLSKEKFQEGMTPSTYAFALVEQRGGRETLTLRTFLSGEVKHLDKAEPEHSQRLLRMLSVFKTTESFLWILKGPPGTGKTQTILGLLNAVLHSAPGRVQSKGGISAPKHGSELQIQDKYCHWIKASPWLSGANPRDLIMPVDGDDGFYPTGNELVEQKLAGVDRSSSGAGKQGSRGADRDRIRASILDESAIVFSTLSFSGSSLFSRMNRVFDVVIIDEAAQAVGDPVQLPATVISSTAERFGYGTSLFKRFQEAGFPVQMLKIQYRMHPEISIFPSKEFYGGFLEDGESVKKTRSPWHVYRCFGPFFFFDVDGVESQPSGSGSWVNEGEVEFIVLLYHKLASKYEDLKSSSQLAVISPYRHQVKLLRERFRATFGEQSDQVVDINTVDGFQGREKDIAIFSCVRANSGKGIGFVSDFRRMNVGITRARSSVLVVGSASTLMQDDHWKNLVKSAQDRKCYYKVGKPYGAFFNDANLTKLRAEDPRKKKAQMVDELHSEMAVMENTAVDNVDDNAEGNEDYGMEGDGGGNDDD
ncbi:hypothetical protein COCNU_15G001830 [Cocos nucifera]|uniref:Helicase MAGATAMA 3 n=1 Tax=Cocos nucifera TaxID=13894 RepID=A0A8K0NCZ3_COCNU|nr:hypothetical protein COCNU_15G001830 [Cocos nucifera]